MTTTPESDDWQVLLGRPRHPSIRLARGDIPTVPGVYAWFKHGSCVYVGKATDLRSRLSRHRSTSLDLSRSTLRASVAVAEVGVTRHHARSRPSVMTPEEIAVVTAWFNSAEVAWVECRTPAEASALEDRLRSGWLPPLNRM